MTGKVFDMIKPGIIRLSGAQHEVLEKAKGSAGYTPRAGKQEQRTVVSLRKLGLVRGELTIRAVSDLHARCPTCKILKTDALPCMRCDQLELL